MDADYWDQLQSLYLKALPLDEAHRESFLKEVAKDNNTLYLRVQALLQADTHPMFEGNALDALDVAQLELNPGDLVDRYRVLEQIGEGGMGLVFRAERADGSYDQTVALKLVKSGANITSVLRRFEVERQILAGLQHPGIAHLLDGGVHEGRPYLVMEYIEGLSITEYCQLHQLDIEARLQLFEQVCAVVAYAHQHLVVHRDLKPSNILVTESGNGRPLIKLLDFGIAKLLDIGTRSAIQTQTASGIKAFTPAYAAPEQVTSKHITTATDIYGLGVVLYELLTGGLPIEPGDRDFLEMSQAILQEEPVVPSQKVISKDAQSAELRRKLTGDLDAIVLKALRKEPEMRYVSVVELVEDLRRHKENLPVLARKDRTGYRMRKFMQRHRVGIWTTMATAAVILSVITVSFVQVVQERDRAQQEATKAAEVGSFLQSIFAIANPTESTGQLVTARELLDRGAARIEEELTDQPVVSAEMAQVIGDAYQNLGQYAAADSMLNLSLTLRKELDPPRPIEVARTMYSMGLLKERFGEHENAMSLHKSGIDLLQSNDVDAPEVLAKLLHGLGHNQMRSFKLDEAERNLEQAVALKRAYYGEVHEEVASSLNVLGDIYSYQERFNDAIAMHIENLALQRALHGETNLHVASSLHNLGAAYWGARQYDESENALREALDIRRKIPGIEARDIANNIGFLASVLRQKEDFEGAFVYHKEAIDMAIEIFGANSYREAIELRRYGYSLLAAGSYEEAEEIAVKAGKIFTETQGTNHSLTAEMITLEGEVIWKQGRFEEAEPLLLQGLQICIDIGDERYECMGNARQMVLEFYIAWGKPDQAEVYKDNS